jgi:hypothetical protein
MAPLVVLVSLLVAAALPAAADPLSVRVVSEISECPSPREVQAALRQALREGEPVTGGWTLWYGRDPAAPLAERDASLLMELANPVGERLVSRRIPTPAGDCAAIGTAMAAVVERSLRGLGWTRGALPAEAVEATKPADGPAMKTEEAVIGKPEASARTVEGRPVPRVVLGAGPMLGSSSRLGTNLLLDARVRALGPFCLRLGVAVVAGGDSESFPSAGTGRVALSSRTFILSPVGTFLLGPVELAGGPVVWLASDRASSSELPKLGSGSRMVMSVGVGIGAMLPLSRRWRLGLELEGVRVAFAPDTYVDWNGARTTVLAPSPWQGMAAAKLEFVPWP